MKKISFGLTKSAAWIAAGLMIGAGVGTGVGFLIINLNDRNEKDNSFGNADSTQNALINSRSIKIEEFPTKNSRESIFGSKTDYTLSDNKTPIKIWNENTKTYDQYVNGDQYQRRYSVVDLGLYTLAYKIRTRLGFGPEIDQLKGIRITPEGNWAEANGVYFGGTNEIFINSTNIIEALNRAEKDLGQQFSKEQEIEFVSEFVFQIIAHEYNHHIAYSYLNSRFSESANAPVKFFKSNPRSVDVKNTTKPETEDWDSDFYNAFVGALNYDGHDIAKDKKFWDEMQQVSNQTSNDGKTSYTPISKYFTASDVFKYANDKNTTRITHTAGNGIGAAIWNVNYDKPESDVKYAYFKNGSVALSYTQDSFLYNYSLAELFARKVQQLTMPVAINFDDLSSGEKYPIPRFRNVKLDTSAPDWKLRFPDNEVFGIDQLVWGSGYGTYSPFILDTKNYADNWGSIPFTSDYLFKNDGTGLVDYANAEKIYTAILNEMGYSGNNVVNSENKSTNLEQADISKIWWQNNSTVNKEGALVYPSKTTMFNMGGYVNDENIKSIGYMEGSEYIKLADVKVSKFAYGMKKTLISSKKYPLNYTESTVNGVDTLTNNDDNFFWTLDDYHDFDSFKGHDLVFESFIIDTKVKDYTLKIEKMHSGKAFSNDHATTIPEELIELKYSLVPLTTYNSEATTWLSSDSLEQRSGINENIARPTYGVDDKGNLTYGIRLQMFDKDNKEVK